MKLVSLSLVTAVAVQLLCQLFKVAYYSVREGGLRPHYFVSAGGIPSAHSAFVTALFVAVGMRSGPGSDVFAVAFVFGMIVIYDAYRLRGEVEKHARLLNRLVLRYHPQEPAELSEMVGHTVPEIVAGIATGAIFSIGVTLVLRSAGM